MFINSHIFYWNFLQSHHTNIFPVFNRTLFCVHSKASTSTGNNIILSSHKRGAHLSLKEKTRQKSQAKHASFSYDRATNTSSANEQPVEAAQLSWRKKRSKGRHNFDWFDDSRHTGCRKDRGLHYQHIRKHSGRWRKRQAEQRQIE